MFFNSETLDGACVTSPFSLARVNLPEIRVACRRRRPLFQDVAEFRLIVVAATPRWCSNNSPPELSFVSLITIRGMIVSMCGVAVRLSFKEEEKW